MGGCAWTLCNLPEELVEEKPSGRLEKDEVLWVFLFEVFRLWRAWIFMTRG